MCRYWILFLFVLWMMPIKAQDNNTDTLLVVNPGARHENPKQWRLGLQSGLSYMWEDTSDEESRLINAGANPSEVDDLYNQIRRGYYLSVDAHRLFKDIWGIGIKYSLMASFAEKYVLFELDDNVNVLHTQITNRRYVNYAGVSFYIQQWFKKAEALYVYSSLSIGYAHYRNEFETDFSSSYFKSNILTTGNTIGGSFEVGLEYFPLHWISIAMGLGCFLAQFDHVDITRGPYGQEVNLLESDQRNASRMDFFVGLRFYFK